MRRRVYSRNKEKNKKKKIKLRKGIKWFVAIANIPLILQHDQSVVWRQKII